MFEAIFDLSIKYKIPSNKIRRNRKLFCGLKKKHDELINAWFIRVQSRINRCEFEKFTEVLLIDKFFCELSDDEIKTFKTTDTWSLKQLNEYFSRKNINNECANLHTANNVEVHVDRRQRPPLQDVKNEVSIIAWIAL